jgi:nitrate reductase alpha subunit
VEPGGKGRARRTGCASLLDGQHDEVVEVAFPISAIASTITSGTDHPSVLMRRVPVRQVQLKDGKALVATVFDLFCANYGVDRGLGGDHVARDYDAMSPTPRPGRKRSPACRRPDHHRRPRIRRQCRQDQGQVDGHPRRRAEPLVSHGHELPRHHQPAGDVRLRANRAAAGRTMWAGKAAPADRLDALAFALDWNRPPRT